MVEIRKRHKVFIDSLNQKGPGAFLTCHSAGHIETGIGKVDICFSFPENILMEEYAERILRVPVRTS